MRWHKFDWEPSAQSRELNAGRKADAGMGCGGVKTCFGEKGSRWLWCAGGLRAWLSS